MKNSILKLIEDQDPSYTEYLWEKIRKEVPDIDKCKSWIFIDGYYGPNYYDFEEEEITGAEADKLRNYCLSQISKAVEAIEDYVFIEEVPFEDEDGYETDEFYTEEIDRISGDEIAKELFHHVVEIYGSLP